MTEATVVDNPIIHVKQLQIDSSGQIKLNATNYLQGVSPREDETVLDYLESNERYYVITAEDLSGKFETSSIELIDTQGGSLQKTTLVSHAEGYDGKDVAYAYWNYGFGVDDGENDDYSKGIYLRYSLSSLELINSGAPLVISLADVKTENLNDLKVSVTGTGIIQVSGIEEKTP